MSLSVERTYPRGGIIERHCREWVRSRGLMLSLSLSLSLGRPFNLPFSSRFPLYLSLYSTARHVMIRYVAAQGPRAQKRRNQNGAHVRAKERSMRGRTRNTGTPTPNNP